MFFASWVEIEQDLSEFGVDIGDAFAEAEFFEGVGCELAVSLVDFFLHFFAFDFACGYLFGLFFSACGVGLFFGFEFFLVGVFEHVDYYDEEDEGDDYASHDIEYCFGVPG